MCICQLVGELGYVHPIRKPLGGTQNPGCLGVLLGGMRLYYPVLWGLFHKLGGWQLKYIWNVHPENWESFIQFDEHIFQRGW